MKELIITMIFTIWLAFVSFFCLKISIAENTLEYLLLNIPAILLFNYLNIRGE